MALLKQIKESIINTNSFNLTQSQKKQIESVSQKKDVDKIIKTANTLADIILKENYYDLATIRNSIEMFLNIGAAYIGNIIRGIIADNEKIRSNKTIKMNFEYYLSSTNKMDALIFYLLCFAEFEYDKNSQIYNDLMFLGKVKELNQYVNYVFSKIPDEFVVNQYILNLKRLPQVDNDKSALKNILLSLYKKNEEIEYEFEENKIPSELEQNFWMKPGFVNYYVACSELKEELFQELKNIFISFINNNLDSVDAFDKFFFNNKIIRPDNYADRFIKELNNDKSFKATDICRCINEIYLHCKRLYTLKFVYSAVASIIHLNVFEKIYEEGKKIAFCSDLTEYIAPILSRNDDGQKILYKIIQNTKEYSRLSAVKYFVPKSTSEFGLLVFSGWENDLNVKSSAVYAFANANLHEAFINDTIYTNSLYSRIFPGTLIPIFNAMVHDHVSEYSIRDLKKFWVILEKYFVYEKNVNYYAKGKEFLINLYNYLLEFDEEDIASIEDYSIKIHNDLLTLVKNEMKK